MTQEEKAKAYDEALERAREFIEASAAYDKFTIEKIFPELKESEDERIRKELIGFVKSRLAGFPECGRFITWLEKQDTFSKKDVDDAYLKGITDAKNEIEKQYEIIFPTKLKGGELTWLTRYIEEEVYSLSMDIRDDEDRIKLKNLKKSLDWFEKQGEKPQGKSALEAVKEEKVDNQNCVKSIDKVESKFKIDDWITNGAYTWKVISVDYLDYTLQNQWGECVEDTVDYVNKTFRLWTIQDAKDGDVLVCDINKAEIGGDVEKLPNIVSTIFIFKNVVSSRDYIHSYCHLYDRHVLGVQNTMYYNSFVYNIHPATKEQRDLLFQKVKEAGCERDADNKELKKVEPKFLVGDWITIDKPCQIISIDDKGNYIARNCDDEKPHILSKKFCESHFHLWTIQDAKDGDVLFHSDSASNGIFIFKKILQRGTIQEVICYCDYDSEDGFCLGEYHTCCWTDSKILHPATQEQRDLLFQKMKEAGYEWDAANKELKKEV